MGSIQRNIKKKFELFDFIRQSIEINDIMVVRVYPDDGSLCEYPQEKLNRNVYAFDSKGEILWQIQEAPQGGLNQDKAYMHISLEDGRLIAGNWIGVDYFVNLDSGLVLQMHNVRPW